VHDGVGDADLAELAGAVISARSAVQEQGIMPTCSSSATGRTISARPAQDGSLDK